MAELTSTATFTIGDSTTASASTQITIIAAPEDGSGSGRLIHPSLGTLDYEKCPDAWSNVDGDVIIAPIWSSNKTLIGSSNTLFPGHIRDTVVEETWVGDDASISVEMMRALVSFWQNPPNPTDDYVEWYPNYTNQLGYKVILLAVDVNGAGVNLNYVTRLGWVVGDVTLRMKIAGRVE